MIDDFNIDEILYGDNDLFDDDVLNEITTFTSTSKNYKISIGVFDDSGGRFKYEPYFKITNGESIVKGSKIARIKFKDLSYVIHRDKFKHWNLTSQDIKILNDIIRSPGNIYQTVWKDLLGDTCRILDLKSPKEFIERYKPDYMYSIPDLNNIHYASKEDWDKAKQKGIGK